jgi:hypothetical protein
MPPIGYATAEPVTSPIGCTTADLLGKGAEEQGRWSLLLGKEAEEQLCGGAGVSCGHCGDTGVAAARIASRTSQRSGTREN